MTPPPHRPPSKADFSGHGANVHGPYDSTRGGSPSANGNGNGKAIGKPCAGCVGKADNKNPPGQMPNGSDANAGYECDRKHGIGRTNPAHTGCTTATTPPSTPPGTSPGTPPGNSTDTPPGNSADTPPSPAAVSPQTPANGAPANDTSGLANTGAINAGLFAGFAAALLVLGVAALALSNWLTRRRTE